MSNPKTVLVTGASGFLGSYVIDSFVKNGWKVKGTVRDMNSASSAALRDRFNSSQLELVLVEDVATDQAALKEAMIGVDAVAHTASPFHTGDLKDPKAEMIDPAVEGTLTALKAAKDAGVKRVVVTSSYAAALNLDEGEFVDKTYTEKDWAPFTLESATAPGKDGGYIYSASKTLAEKAAWDYANQNGVQLATILPPMIYGPPLQPVPSKDKLNASSAAIYALIDGDKGRPVPPNIWIHNVAVEDAALAHVRAAECEGAAGHRFLVGGNTMLWEDAILHLKNVRPELSERLPALPEKPKDYGAMTKMDCTPSKKVLDLKFKPWQQVVEETVDKLVEMEKAWQA